MKFKMLMKSFTARRIKDACRRRIGYWSAANPFSIWSKSIARRL